MNRKLSGRNIILNIIYFLMVFSLMYVVGVVIHLDISFPRQMLYALIVSMAIKFIFKHMIVFYLSLILLFVGGLVVNSYVTPIYPYIERLFELFNNIYEHLSMNKVILDENILPFWILITGIYSIFTTTILFRPRRKFFSLIIIYLPLFVYYWYMYVNEAYIALAIFFFCYFVLQGMLSFHKEKDEIELDNREQFTRLSSFWNRTSLVYGILIVIIALILPKSDKSFRWYWMEDQIASLIPKIEEMRSTNSNVRGIGKASKFNYASTGFQEDPSKLGGPVSPDNRLIMYVRTNGPTYLRGTVRHYYDGSAWETISSDISSHLLESNFGNVNYDERQKFYNEKNVIVQFTNYSSTTLFSPYKPIVANADRGDKINLTKDYIMELPEGIYDGESYGIKVLETKPYGELLHLGFDKAYQDIDNIEIYLQVPSDRLTERTIELKDDIVAGIDNNLEKAIAIESYLRENYEYNLDTSEVPDGHEFIDYFLFEEQAGYCTYYATTMAIFLRLEGIPSRYVEGFIVQETEDGEIYNVRKSHAHAWVEAFIEPVGWMTFEPTSIYPAEDRVLEYSPEEEASINDEKDEKLERNDHLDQQIDSGISADDNIGIDDDSEITNLETKDQLISGKTILTILGIILLIYPARFLIKILIYLVNEYKINKLSNYDKMLVLYKKILELTEKLGSESLDGETHYEYSNRVGYKFKGLKDITDIFVKNKYSNTSPSDNEIQEFIDFRKDLEKHLKAYYGRIKYYLKKF